MKTIKHYRHATSVIEIDNKRILIDPVLGDKGVYPAITNSKNPRKNPLVNLPAEIEDILDVDGIIITHNHNDHFDIVAKKILARDVPILCQEEDYLNFKKLGFVNLTLVKEKTIWLGIKVQRFIGTHGGHIFNKKLGVSSSYLLTSTQSKIYLTGDTLLTISVIQNLKKIKPNYIIANGGGAKIKMLGKVTMNNKDIDKLARLNNNCKIIVVHMDSINHCFDTRVKLFKQCSRGNLVVPLDGEKISFINNKK
ncbi:MBL fold metallo-hydrolase [Thiospirochaeta perfilievii]|uniref:MBL fold metallo-hydrolase n=1 Tax=Thiospirochaeta perfilievii TaxID=252967 RepID=A0A5C1QBU7_9SPIO|nr:MBL fold metallo-hydrolase [Thiospirochaeta perfilievii]QEN04339.1 MBL fold metallo-hydrolase [Thiospirochaeta perfilievii]